MNKLCFVCESSGATAGNLMRYNKLAIFKNYFINTVLKAKEIEPVKKKKIRASSRRDQLKTAGSGLSGTALYPGYIEPSSYRVDVK